MQPYRHSSSPLPFLDESIQDRFITTLLRKLSALEEALSNQIQHIKEKDIVQVPLRDPVLFLARLLQFDLGFPGAWTQGMKDVGDQVIDIVLRLALLHGGGPMTDPVAFPLILDTAFYVFDGT